jgi:lysozyme
MKTLMKASVAGRSFIKSFEQCRLTPYRDSGGVWTNGWGHTGADVKAGVAITQVLADSNFERDLGGFERDVNKLVDVPITQSQFDALVSFAYNVGSDIDEDLIAEGLGDSTLLRKLNASDYVGAANQFPLWNKCDGTVLRGLTNRRLAERNIFQFNKYVNHR